MGKQAAKRLKKKTKDASPAGRRTARSSAPLSCMPCLLPIRAKVLKNEKENSLVSLLTLDLQMPHAMPGQFLMAWQPGMDEKPMSIAENRPSVQLAIAAAGPCSKKLAETKAGEYIYVRGPLGKPFWPAGKKWLMVGGGYGFAPLRFLARVGMENGAKVESICGARTKGLLMKAGPGKNYQTTDDGSAGTKGNVIAALGPLLASSRFDCVYSCGPEKMMKAVAEACKKHGVKSQLSVERYMKCGFGVCGHCAMGSWLSCIDGPSIDGEEALENPAFGAYHVDKAGRKIRY
ncbi:MAG: dihydroorotate dehydrogenase electron transfer subunit [Candidatus Marsarchaeota archaeon]|nr:dihydroorotate dehydrogenase electron transfer subunit [Candidatus Marsarchaeota archaeon]